ncbi:PKD-like family lipoprotein [Pedobacter sp. AW31-3R]|uniref:PKD-like family lipoprotein n=1 Tax=Pedobacter sp. AW31-3R TaxID=3445781 RepID=UPI003FA07ADE
MRRFILLLLVTVCLASCLKDDGNYTYTPVQPVKTMGIADAYRVFLQTSLTIPVTLTTAIDEADLTFNWMMEGDTLCRTKDFNYTFSNEATAAHVLVFEAKNNKTNVRYTTSTKLTIVSPFQTGWAFLTESNHQAGLSFLSYEGEGELYKDVYKTINGEALGTGAVVVKQIYDFDVNRIAILCKAGNSVDLDGTTLARIKYYQTEFKAPGFEPLAINAEQFANDRFLFLISGGKIYSKNVGYNSVDDANYEFPLDGDNKGYELAGNYTKGPLYDYYLVYDQLNKRYLRFARASFSTVVSPLPLAQTSTPAFDPNNVAGESVWMGQSSSAKALSVIKTPSGKYVLHVLNSEFVNGLEKWTAQAAYEFPDGVVTANSCFAAHATNPYLLIGTGRSLKALNLDALSQGAVAVNAISTYDAEITAISYAYSNAKSVNELALGLNTGDAEFPGSLLIINSSLTANGAVIRRVDKVGGVIKSMLRKIQ